MRRNLCLASFVILFLSLSASAQAGGRGSTSESLRGIEKIALVVERVETFTRPVNSQADTPTKDQVRAGVEEQLRVAGIKLAEPAAGKQGAPTPTLHLSLMAHKDEKGYNHYALRLWLTQEVTLSRASPFKVVASTWESAAVAYGAGHQIFERAICERVHDFIVDYKFANSGSAEPPASALLPPGRYNGPCPLAKQR